LNSRRDCVDLAILVSFVCASNDWNGFAKRLCFGPCVKPFAYATPALGRRNIAQPVLDSPRSVMKLNPPALVGDPRQQEPPPLGGRESIELLHCCQHRFRQSSISAKFESLGY